MICNNYIKGDKVLIVSKDQLIAFDRSHEWPFLAGDMLNCADKMKTIKSVNIDSIYNNYFSLVNNDFIWIPKLFHPFVIRNYKLILLNGAKS